MRITDRQLRRIVREAILYDEEGSIDLNSLTSEQLDEYDLGYDDALAGGAHNSETELYLAGYEAGTHDRPQTLKDNPRFAALDRSGFRRPR